LHDRGVRAYTCLRDSLGTARSTQHAPLHVAAFGGMLDGVSGPCEHPFTVLVVGTATALFGCMIVIAVALSGIAAPTTTTTPAGTTASAAATTQ
jgi:hypothetical protein